MIYSVPQEKERQDVIAYLVVCVSSPAAFARGGVG
jgi:hypothetical protein